MEKDSESYIATRLEDPEFAAAYEDADGLLEVLETLARRRKNLDLTQRVVAYRMKTTQSAVSDLESAQTDPRVSTLQRYARAVDSKLVLRVASQSSYSWSHSVTTGAAFTPTGMSWTFAGSLLFGAYAARHDLNFGLGALGFRYDAAAAVLASPDDDRAAPSESVLAA
jgi:transcriptional regulator with XRE-family HTH domain